MEIIFQNISRCFRLCFVLSIYIFYVQFPVFLFYFIFQWSLMWMDRHKINITIPVGTFNSPTLLASFIWRIFFLLFTVLPVGDFIVLFKQETWIHNLHFNISTLTFQFWPRGEDCQDPWEMFYQLTFHLMVERGNVSDIFDQRRILFGQN